MATRISTSRAHAPGRHQRTGQRPDVRGYPPAGVPWGQSGWGGGGGGGVPLPDTIDVTWQETGMICDCFIQGPADTPIDYRFHPADGGGPITGSANAAGYCPLTYTYAAAGSYDATLEGSADAGVSWHPLAARYVTVPAAGAVLDGTIDEVKTYVDGLTMDDNRDDIIQALLDHERANRNRATLVSWLDQQTGVE